MNALAGSTGIPLTVTGLTITTPGIRCTIIIPGFIRACTIIITLFTLMQGTGITYVMNGDIQKNVNNFRVFAEDRTDWKLDQEENEM